MCVERKETGRIPLKEISIKTSVCVFKCRVTDSMIETKSIEDMLGYGSSGGFYNR